MSKTIALVLVLIVPTVLCSQLELSHHTYNSKTGLRASHIYGIVQDSNGFLWIGTSTGLMKFDGDKFVETELPNINNSEVLELKIDNNDNLWFLNLANQLCKYSTRKGLEIVELEHSYALNHTWIKDGNIGVFHNVTSGILIDEEELIEKEIEPNEFFIPVLNGDLQIKRNSLLHTHIVKNDSIFKVISYLEGTPETFFKFGDSYYFTTTTKEKLIKLIRNGDQYSTEKVHISSTPIKINGISELSDSTIHLVTNSGVLAYKNDFTKLTDHFFKDVICTDSHIDNENNLWISTKNKGLIFSHFSKIKTYRDLKSTSISRLHSENDSVFWVGTHKGSIYRVENNIVEQLPTNINEPIRFITNASGLTVIGNDSYISIYDKNKLLSNSSIVRCIKGAIKVTENKLLVSTCSGYRILKIVDAHAELELEALGKRIYSIAKDVNNESTLLSTNDGIYKRLHNHEEMTLEMEFDLDKYNIIDIIDTDGLTWLASSNNGVIGLREDSIIHNLNKDNFLKTNYVFDIYIDRNESLWIATNSGLTHMDVAMEKSYTLNSSDGLSSDIVHTIIEHGDNILVGTSSGLDVVNSNTKVINGKPPPIYLESTLVDGKTNNLNSLSGKEQNFRFKFQGINYSSLGSSFYKYRLKGLSDRWIHISNDIDEVIYNKLPAGEYTFEVLAINEDGIESSQPASISFNLPQPYYSRWWFVLLSILVSLALMSFLFYLRLKHIKNQNQLEMNIRAHQLTALKAQMKPHFISNILNSIQSHSMLKDPMMVNSYITRLSKFVRNVLNMSDAELVSLENELEVLVAFIELEQLRSNHSFKYSLHVDKTINTNQFFLPPMLIQPYVENAIIHGVAGLENGKIELDIKSIQQNTIQIAISDNGNGIRNDHNKLNVSKHISMGTIKNAKRIELLNEVYKKRFSVNVSNLETNGNTGTQVLLDITNLSNYNSWL